MKSPNSAKTSILLFIVVCVILLHTSRSAIADVTNKTYIFGVFPFLPVIALEDAFAPVAAEISSDIRHPVRLNLTSSYSVFIADLQRQAFDIVYMHPFDYVRYGHANGYIPLVARTEGLYAIFTVKRGSRIRKISDLKGKRLGTPPATGAVTYLALHALHHAGISLAKDVKLKYFHNHFSCLQQMQIGNIDSCVTSPLTLKAFESQFGLRVVRIGQSIKIPAGMFAVHNRVPKHEQERIKASLTDSSEQAVNDKDYEQVRTILKELGID